MIIYDYSPASLARYLPTAWFCRIGLYRSRPPLAARSARSANTFHPGTPGIRLRSAGRPGGAARRTPALPNGRASTELYRPAAPHERHHGHCGLAGHGARLPRRLRRLPLMHSGGVVRATQAPRGGNSPSLGGVRWRTDENNISWIDVIPIE
jgi:hypothetical protein